MIDESGSLRTHDAGGVSGACLAAGHVLQCTHKYLKRTPTPFYPLVSPASTYSDFNNRCRRNLQEPGGTTLVCLEQTQPLSLASLLPPQATLIEPIDLTILLSTN
jgi:hypothetical protein